MESVKFNYKAIELELARLVLEGGVRWGCMLEIGMRGISLCVCACVCMYTGRLYIVMEQCYGECL
jgi:hypothetical protein